MTTQTFKHHAGIDWASDHYDLCVVDESGTAVGKKRVEHSGDGIRECIEWVLQMAGGDASSIAIAIEVPHGAMVESLIENNLAVFALNPKQMDRFRDRHTVAGAKDEDLDAFVMADSLRTDQRCFHRVELDEPAVLRLRELSRMADDLQTDSNRLANQFVGAVAALLSADAEIKLGRQRGLVMGSVGVRPPAGQGRQTETGEGESDSAGASHPPHYR